MNHTSITITLGIWLLALLTVFTTTTNADIPRPRGVSLAKASLYSPNDEAKQSWVCLDGSKTIRFVQINDDYCDCVDGSDEPGTSACAQGQFHCGNRGHKALNIPSSRVNDGICDCCDGSDEYSSAKDCEKVCDVLGRAELEKRKVEMEMHKLGGAKRSELIAKGKQLRAEREARRIELESRRVEQDALKAEKEELKRNAEAAESEAVDLYKEQEREQDAINAELKDAEASHVEAEATFLRYDTNNDGFIEITELQVDILLDGDRNGVVTVEEAKYYLDERDRIDLDGFKTLSWPRIKPMLMVAQGIFKPPVLYGDEDGEKAQQLEETEEILPTTVEGTEEHEENPADTEAEEEEQYEDEDVETGEGVVTAEESTPAPEYDPETQRLIYLANEARNAFADAEREVRDIDNELKDINDQNSKDYGANEEYASMDGECYTFEDREYVYTLCPFDRTSQKQRSGGGSETTLGRWTEWLPEGGNKYAKQKYEHGSSCWNGPQRSAVVQLKCALEPRITSVAEPNRCEYLFELETPAACDGGETQDDASLHDEL